MLRKVRGKILLTHPKCPLYEEMLSDWQVIEVAYRNTSAIGKGSEGAKVKDAIWLNYKYKGVIENALQVPSLVP
jgi:hypothetical protein